MWDQILVFPLKMLMIIFFMIIFQYICICLYRFIGLVGRVFDNGLGDLGSIPGHVTLKTFKMVLGISLLNTQQYKIFTKGSGAIHGKELLSPLLLGVVATEKGAFWSPSTTVANYMSVKRNRNYFPNILIYIYIYVCVCVWYSSIIFYDDHHLSQCLINDLHRFFRFFDH